MYYDKIVYYIHTTADLSALLHLKSVMRGNDVVLQFDEKLI